MSNSSFEIIQPRNTLREKLGNKTPAIDPAALARAEAALKSLSGQFQSWMEDEVEKVDAARMAARAAGFDEPSLQGLYDRAHDAKGMGSTYEYPLVTRIAGSLCRLLDDPSARSVAQRASPLLEAHVDALKAAVRDHIRSDEHPVGKVLAEELEGQVAKLMAAMGSR